MFKSAHHALQFAFRVTNTPIVKTSSLGGMLKSHGGGDIMTPHDKHAQAAMVMSLVERAVDVNGMAYLCAHYGAELRGGERKADVLAVLVRAAVSSMPTGMHARRGVSKMIEAHFGVNYSMVSIRKDLGCNNRRYYEYKQWIGDAMDGIGLKAEDDAHRALESAGLIEVAA